MRVGIVGLGRMGLAYARRLTEKGHEVYLYSRRGIETARQEASKIGCRVLERVQDVDVLLLAGWDDEYILDVWERLGIDEFRGVVVNVATVSPTLSERLSRRHELYVEAPVVGGPRVVEEGRAVTILASRSSTAAGKAKSVVEAYSSRIVEVGEPPRAMVIKLAFNMILFNTIAGLAEAVGYLEAHGIDPEALRSVLAETWLAELSERYWRRAFTDTPASFRLEGVVKDLRLFVDESSRVGYPALVSAAALAIYSLAKRVCDPNVDYPRVVKCIKEAVANVKRAL